MKKGDIVLIPFPFTDLTGNKKRPAIVLIDSEDDVTIYHLIPDLYSPSRSISCSS
jgi:mRNA interferase MazF